MHVVTLKFRFWCACFINANIVYVIAEFIRLRQLQTHRDVNELKLRVTIINVNEKNELICGLQSTQKSRVLFSKNGFLCTKLRGDLFTSYRIVMLCILICIDFTSWFAYLYYLSI